MRYRTHVSWLLAIAFAGMAQATNMEQLRSDWAHVRYELPQGQQLDAMLRVKDSADSALAAAPGDAGLLIWDAIITSTVAGLKGGLGALSLVKEARSHLEKAEQVQPGAYGGSALTSLGALYYQVPGWPLGFGDKEKARSNLQAALKIDPDGIDTNYFYADFLYSQGDYSGAQRAAQHALAASPRPGRELADKGRRGEIMALMDKIGRKTGDGR
jgi:tetratricopeptide (TPR) repeat protein